jgi:hypothetical protein
VDYKLSITSFIHQQASWNEVGKKLHVRASEQRRLNVTVLKHRGLCLQLTEHNYGGRVIVTVQTAEIGVVAISDTGRKTGK